MKLTDTIYAQTTRDARFYYDKGMALKEAGDYDAAITSFRKAARKDREFADAYYQLGLCYMNVDYTATALPRAYNAFKQAVIQDRTNTDYLFAMAELQKDRYNEEDAVVWYEKILDIDPDNVEALGKLAEIYEKKVNEYRYRVKVNDAFMLYDNNLLSYLAGGYGGLSPENITEAIYRSAVGIELNYSTFADEDRVKAVVYNSKIIEHDAGNRDALFRLGLLYYDKGETDRFIELFSSITRKYPEDKDALLFLGLGYAKKGEHETSDNFYMKARDLMNPEEREVFENIDYIDSGIEEISEGMFTGTAGKDRYWQRKDPFFITPFNERRNAHYGRVAEANLRFSQPKLDLPGWRTDRGRIFIRYGEPNKIADFHQAYDALDVGGNYHFDPAETWWKFQFWYYDNFSFVFSTYYADYDNKYRLGTFQKLDFLYIEEKVEEVYPDYYRYIPKGELLDMIVNVVTFRGKTRGKSDAAFFYGMPLNKIELNPDLPDIVKGELQHGVFIFNEQWDKISQIIDTTLVVVDQDEQEISEDVYVVSTELELDPGMYNIGVEVLDPGSGNTSSLRDKIAVEEYTGESLQISDILISHKIIFEDLISPVSRDNISFYVSPTHGFRTGQSMNLYFEIYNLFLSPEDGRSRYRIDYTIYPSFRKDQGMTGFLKKMVGLSEKEEGQAISFEYGSARLDENVLQIIDLNISKPGEYRLTVQVTDLSTGESVNKSTLLRIF
ncbi:GWxTD domain-containing protein [candidate division KSB1 bacterium]